MPAARAMATQSSAEPLSTTIGRTDGGARPGRSEVRARVPGDDHGVDNGGIGRLRGHGLVGGRLP